MFRKLKGLKVCQFRITSIS